MKLRWLRPFVVLTAALIVCISNIIAKRPVVESLILLLVVIIVFFIIGSIGTSIIDHTMNAVSKNDPQEGEAPEDEEEQQEEATEESETYC